MAKTIKGRKFVATAATAALVASAIVPVASASTEFKDASKISDWAAKAVDFLVTKEILVGDEAGNFIPQGELTRGQAAKILALALELKVDATASSTFADAKGHWSDAYIAAIVAHNKAIITGFEDGTFRADGKISREQFAKMVVEAFEIELDETKEVAAFTDVSEWATKYVQILTSQGIVTGLGGTKFGGTDTLTREQGAVFAHRTLVEDVRVEVADKVVAVTTATKVASVTATNLKEFTVTFDGTVDKTSAGEVANYSLSGANSPEVDSVSVSEDAKSVTLTVKNFLTNQNEYKLSYSNIKAGDKVLNEKDLAFKPLDITVPTVSKVEALGNKTVRVTFSEPIKAAQTSHFTIDGKVVVGSIQTTKNSVIIKLSSALTDGEHTITAEGISDYNDFKVIKAENKFNVVEDKTAPTVTSVVSASFEKVVLKFSEPVEQVFASNVYWMQGASKKQASNVKALADDTYEFTFSDSNKLVYTTDLYVTNVKDYSGNVIDKDTKVQVTPVIDQTRPEVLSTAFVSGSDNKQIVIKFSKSLDSDTAKKAANYVIKDKDGKVQYISGTVDVSKDKEVTITLLNTLKDNQDYTLSITGVSDNTTLKNVILPYSTTLSVKDVTPPTFDKVTRLNSKQLYVEFNEAMATSGDGSIVDSAKYTIKNKGDNNKTLSPASFNVTGDSKGVILSFNNDLPAAGNIEVTVQLVKDLAGNYLKDLKATKDAVAPTATNIKSVIAVATDKVEVEFTKAIQSLNQGDFEIEGHQIAYSELSSNGKVVTFTLKGDLTEDVKTPSGTKLKLTVATSPSTVDILSEKIASAIDPQDIEDEINATVKKVEKADDNGNKIKITFNEAVTASQGSNTDFVVKDNLGNTVAVTNVSATNSTELVITLEKAVVAATVSAKDVRFVKDAAGNTIADIDATTVELGGDTVAPSVTTKLPGASTLTADGTHTLVFSEALNADSKVAVKDAVDAAFVKAGTATVTSAWNAAGTILTVTIAGADALGTNQVDVSSITAIAVTDIAGNTSAALALQ